MNLTNGVAVNLDSAGFVNEFADIREHVAVDAVDVLISDGEIDGRHKLASEGVNTMRHLYRA